jgi:hypothetical protein
MKLLGDVKMKMRSRRRWTILMGTLVATLAAGGGALAAGLGSTPVPAAPSVPAGAELSTIQQLVKNFASANGDATPANAVIVPTTRQVAEQQDAGAVVSTNEPDYYVILHGHFVAHDAHVPPGASLPTGTVLTLTVDPSSNTITDWGISDAEPNADAVGAPQPLPLP